MQEDTQEHSRFRSFQQQQPTQPQAPVYQPGVSVQIPDTITGEIDAAKAGMVFSIVGGVIALMFAIGRFMTSELDSDMEFLYLGLGASVLVLCSYAFVEVQHRRHGQISIVHDYVLAFGHLFTVLGAFWLTRWGLYMVCGQWPDDGTLCHGSPGSVDWMPGEWGVFVQASAFALIGFAQWSHNERVGGTTLPHLVSMLSPLVILLIGARIWVDWSDGAIGLPLILSAVMLTGMGMWLGSVSNRAPLFLSAAGLSSLIPLVYGFRDAGLEGQALSLLALVILMQGVFASARGLSRSMIQHGTIALVLIVVITEFVALVNGYPVVFVQEIDLPFLTLPLLLWLSLLIGYFIPVHQRRVPWMPIGLAVGLSFVPSPGSAAAWALAIIAFTYMLTKPQTRRWVSDWTYAMLATSWFVVDWLSSFGEPFDQLALDPLFLVIPPAALLILGQVATRHGRLSKGPYHIAVALILLSHEMLFSTGALLPLCFVGYLMLLVANRAVDAESIGEDDFDSRRDVSVLMLLTGSAILLLELLGRLDTGVGESLGLGGFGAEALVLAVMLYALGRSLRKAEFDIGQVFGWAAGAGLAVTEWDPLTGAWSSKTTPLGERLQKKSWGPAMRASLILPLTIFSAASSELSETWAVFLLIMPIAVLMREILFELPKDNRTRAGGAWLLFFTGLPWSWRIHQQLLDANPDSLQLAQIAFDAIILAGPLLGHFMLMRQGVKKEEGDASDNLLLGIIAIALLDTSGGLLLVTLLSIAFHRAVMHRQVVALNILPFAWGLGIFLLKLLPETLVGLAPQIEYLVDSKNSLLLGASLPIWSSIGFLILGLIPLVIYARERRSGEEVEVEMPTIVPTLSILIGLHLLVAESHILMLAAVVLAGVGAWYVGQLALFTIWPFMFLTSLSFFAEGEEIWGQNTLPEAAAVTSLVCLAIHILFWRGVMEYRASEAKAGKFPSGPFDLRAEYEFTRKCISDWQLLFAVICSLISLNVWWGLPFLLISFTISIRAWLRREQRLMMFGSVLEAMAIMNTVDQAVDFQDTFLLGGVYLVLCGLLYTWSSWRNWDFEWRELSDEEVATVCWEFGIGGALLVTLGAFWTSIDQGAWLFGAVLSTFGGLQMMIGFEKDEKWRRIYTLVTIPLGILIVAGDIENGVLQGVMYLLAALTLFGQGFLYMSRAGVEMAGTGAVPQASPSPLPAVHLEVEESETEPTAVAPLPAPAPPPPSRFDSGEGFMVELPADVVGRIRHALTGQAYEGYQPIIKWDEFGRVIIDFEPEG